MLKQELKSNKHST
uniref:Uncharacterized protein n=1 Tax=Anguilla anguilla TaxID=7936 RepID=A0A0E9RSM5_ANGAN